MAPPLSANAFLAALVAEGLDVVEVGNWRDHNRNHAGPWGPVHGVMIHHTVTKGSARTVDICRTGYADLPGPLCHGVIAKDGTVYLIGYGRANHAGLGDADVLRAVIAEQPLPADNETNTDGNPHFYGFECENLGDGKDPWPAAQLEAIERAAAAVCRAHGWDERSVIGHLEWQPGKVDPRGFTMSEMRARIHDRLTGGTTPTKPEQEDPMAGLTRQDVSDAVWQAPVAAPDTAPDRETRPTWWAASYLRAIYGSIVSLQSTVAAQTAAITALAGQVGKGADTATIVAAVERAIADAVVKVDVDITGPAAS